MKSLSQDARPMRIRTTSSHLPLDSAVDPGRLSQRFLRAAFTRILAPQASGLVPGVFDIQPDMAAFPSVNDASGLVPGENYLSPPAKGKGEVPPKQVREPPRNFCRTVFRWMVNDHRLETGGLCGWSED